MNSRIEIGALIELSDTFQNQAVFCILENSQISAQLQNERFKVFAISAFQPKNAALQWATQRPLCGNTSTQYHPKFLMAMLSSSVVWEQNSTIQNFLDWKIPAISFATNSEIRTSMTLNGMRMSTEYFATGSLRLLQLVEQRLAAGQSDVVHDILIYLMERVLQLRAQCDEERSLQSQSFAAYLGLDVQRVLELLIKNSLDAKEFSRQIEDGFAGTPRKSVNISALIENQWTRFSAEMESQQKQQDRVLQLLDEVVARLYNCPIKSQKAC